MGCANAKIAPPDCGDLDPKLQRKVDADDDLLFGVPTTLSTSDVIEAPAAAEAITEAEVRAAQDLWAASIVRISASYLEKGDFVKIAGDAAGELYAYGHHDVLFKPTKYDIASAARPSAATRKTAASRLTAARASRR